MVLLVLLYLIRLMRADVNYINPILFYILPNNYQIWTQLPPGNSPFRDKFHGAFRFAVSYTVCARKWKTRDAFLFLL